MTEPLFPPFIALHTAKPLPEAFYMNNVVTGPRLVPFTWENDTDELVHVRWISAWEPERCLALRPLELTVTGIGSSITVQDWDRDHVGDWEAAPIPRWKA